MKHTTTTASEQEPKLKQARFLAEKGWSLIPIKPGDKKPAIEWKQYQTERADDATLERWFGDGHFDIGIVTGAISGIDVVDIEGKAIAAKQPVLSELPPTLTATTPSGGKHLFFKHAEGIRNASLKDVQGHWGDVRGDGGYVVAPPSQGREWLDLLVEPAPFPSGFFSSVLPEQPSTAPKEVQNRWQEAVAEIDGRTDYGDNPVRWGMAVAAFKWRPEGDRHNMLCILAKAARNAGVLHIEAVRELVNACKANGYYVEAGEPKVLKDIEDGWSWGADDPENPLGFQAGEDIADGKVEWLWRGMWKRGKLGGHVGEPETYKTTSIVALCADLTRGRRLPGEELMLRRGAVP